MLDLILHADVLLADFVRDYGLLTYGILFAIIFAETGLVVTPFLPGDSLLFAAGALAATGAFRLELLVPVMVLAAIAGNAVNYMVGRRVAHLFKLDAPETSMHRWVKRDTSSAPTSSSSNMAAAPWSWRGSCRSSARFCRSSPAAPA